MQNPNHPRNTGVNGNAPLTNAQKSAQNAADPLRMDRKKEVDFSRLTLALHEISPKAAREVEDTFKYLHENYTDCLQHIKPLMLFNVMSKFSTLGLECNTDLGPFLDHVGKFISDVAQIENTKLVTKQIPSKDSIKDEKYEGFGIKEEQKMADFFTRINLEKDNPGFDEPVDEFEQENPGFDDETQKDSSAEPSNSPTSTKESNKVVTPDNINHPSWI